VYECGLFIAQPNYKSKDVARVDFAACRERHRAGTKYSKFTGCEDFKYYHGSNHCEFVIASMNHYLVSTDRKHERNWVTCRGIKEPRDPNAVDCYQSYLGYKPEEWGLPLPEMLLPKCEETIRKRAPFDGAEQSVSSENQRLKKLNQVLLETLEATLED